MAIEDDRLLAIFHVGSEGAVLVGGQADEGRLAQRHRRADFSALLGVTAWGLLRPGAVPFEVILSSL